MLASTVILKFAGQQYCKWLLTMDLYNVSMVNLSLLLKTLETQIAIDRAREEMVFMWGLHDKSRETMTPKSFNWSTGKGCRHLKLHKCNCMHKLKAKIKNNNSKLNCKIQFNTDPEN